MGGAPVHDKIRGNGQRQYLDQSAGHNHTKFGGSSLPAGRARATKTTAGLRGIEIFTLAISHLLVVDPVGNAPAQNKIRGNGQRQYLDQSAGHDHRKFSCSSLIAGGAKATKATAGLRGLQQFTLAISHLLASRSGG